MNGFFKRVTETSVSEFPLFTVQHFIVILISLAIIYLSYRYAYLLRNNKHEKKVRFSIAIVLFSTSLYIIIYAIINNLPWYKYIPEATCGWAALLGTYTLITKNRFAFILTFFYGWGALSTIFAPNLLEGITRLYFYQFYIRHIIIVIVPLYMMRVFDFKIFKRDNLIYIFVTLPASLIGWILSYLINNPEEANFFYMLRPAVNNTLLDIFYNISPILYTFIWLIVAIVFGFVYGTPFYERKNTTK